MTEEGQSPYADPFALAKLKQNAALEDIDFKTARGLDRSLIIKLADCGWVKEHLNVLITGGQV